MIEDVEVQVHLVVKITADAVLVAMGDSPEDETHWIPRSVIDDTDEDLEEGTGNTLYIQEWFALKEGLI